MKAFSRTITATAMALAFLSVPTHAFTLNDAQGTSVSHGGQALRTVAITPETRWVNVSYGDTVRFVAPNGKEFLWLFDGMADSVGLSTIVPMAGMPHAVVYIDQAGNPARSGGAD